MKPIASFVVSASLPENIYVLKELAYNYWWCWNADAQHLFTRIDPELWEKVNHNPVMLLNCTDPDRLKELSEQADFISYLEHVYKQFCDYMGANTWYQSLTNHNGEYISYFCLEYGINESFPNYSGGLGILAGDHLKSASDLGIPIIGVGLLYQTGYFRQSITQVGWQQESYFENDFFSMPMMLMRRADGSPTLISVEMPLGTLYAQIWKVMIGRAPLYLLDTNIAENNRIPEYRDITDQLYGGSTETRIQQEILLGIGGVRALKEIGVNPIIIHINEGHAAFATLERARLLMQEYNLDFRVAGELTHAGMIFTTHTPVPAGNEVFSSALIDKYFSKYWTQLGLTREEFLSLGKYDSEASLEAFSMTILALRLSSFRNGVSELHGNVARKMWNGFWGDFPEHEVPIGHVTNGIHTLSWVAEGIAELYDRYLSPRWRAETFDPAVWSRVDAIPNEELWRVHQRYRERLTLFARDHYKKKQQNSLSSTELSKISGYLNPDALTIGFARRFASYKRAILLFSDMERLKKILLNEARPVQIVISGKAHPHDNFGKEIIQKIIHNVKVYGLEQHVVFLEDYSIAIARRMVKGCDIWLNTPIRPQEASGTSGMKAGLNGCLHTSILDGWWAEAYNGENGFTIGNGEESSETRSLDEVEANLLYELLEQFIVPEFYDRVNNIPIRWVQKMKASIKSIAGQFSTSRMLRDYTNKYYLPAIKQVATLKKNNAEKAVILRDWKIKMKTAWSQIAFSEVHVGNVKNIVAGDWVEVFTKVYLGAISPEDVIVQAYFGDIASNGDIANGEHVRLQLEQSHEGGYYDFRGRYQACKGGKQGCTVRILPYHPNICNSEDMRICTWA